MIRIDMPSAPFMINKIGQSDFDYLDLIGSVKGLDIWSDFHTVEDDDVRFFAVRKGTRDIVMQADFQVWPDNTLSVISTKVARKYQGFSIVPMIYSEIIRSLGVVMMSGAEQSVGGRRIWNELNKMKGLFLYAIHDTEGYQVESDDDIGELTCDEVDLYNTYIDPELVRVCASAI